LGKILLDLVGEPSMVTSVSPVISRPDVLIVMGVSGSGKSSVGAALARRSGGQFFDCDDYHPRANVEKMSRGEPLQDADREPWLARMAEEVVATAGERAGVTVLACSALKEVYRSRLVPPGAGVEAGWVFLDGDFETVRARLDAREGHFMKANLLESQFATLERPAGEDVLTVDIRQSVEEILEQVGARWPGLWKA
jgi:carbohydrate kinase (thermoresistant glucokinase family)